MLSNRKILEICGTENVLDYVIRMQENYLGHIARQKNTSIVKRLLFKGKSADNFYREALKKRKKDMFGSSSSHSKESPASMS